jgi:hypothetical protein
MKTIWKYEIPITDEPAIKVIAGANLINLQAQNDKIFAWVLVDSGIKIQETKRFRIFGTGNPVDSLDELEFYTTVQTQSPDGFVFIWHIFGYKKDDWRIK